MSSDTSQVQSVWDAIYKIRDPRTRWITLRVLIIGCALAAFSIVGTTLFTKIMEGIISNAVQRMAFPARAAEIDRLRQDAEAAPCESIQQLLAVVVATNQEIDAQKRRLSTWWLRFDVTRKWDTIPPIEIPCGGSHAKIPRK